MITSGRGTGTCRILSPLISGFKGYGSLLMLCVVWLRIDGSGRMVVFGSGTGTCRCSARTPDLLKN